MCVCVCVCVCVSVRYVQEIYAVAKGRLPIETKSALVSRCAGSGQGRVFGLPTDVRPTQTLEDFDLVHSALNNSDQKEKIVVLCF